jgi:hypothetical protein
MIRRERGSSLLIAVLTILILTAISVGLLRFTHRSVSSALGGPRHKALVDCAAAGRALLESRFHLLGVRPTEIAVLDEMLDGPGGRLRAVGGHVDADPSLPLATIKQVEPLPPEGLPQTAVGPTDATNVVGGLTGAGFGTGGEALKVTVHCQEGDVGSPTSGRQLEIEYGIRFGL